MKSLTDQLKIQIEKLSTKVGDSLQSLAYWEETVKEQTTELVRLRKALAALEGKPETKFPDLLAPQLAPMSVVQRPQNGNEATLNGEKIILEPGFKIGKNSFGEDCIVPLDAADYPKMDEPTKPISIHAYSVDLPSSTETLDRPEDLL